MINDYKKQNPQVNPRFTIIKSFTTLLINNNIGFEKNLKETLKIAKTIEKSCYNAIIDKSKNSENPPCRKWTSIVFLEMYSNKCGMIYNLLDITSNTYNIYKPRLVYDILEKKIDLTTIGFIPEKILCSQSIIKEKEEIEIRSEQYVKEKESNLFRCPKCKQRKITYKEVQLRALDEAPDYICRCLNCGHTFKGKN
jgi:transcription elongation factor S-II